MSTKSKLIKVLGLAATVVGVAATLVTDEFSGIEHDERNDSFIFSVAHDVATDILDILRAMN